MEKIKVIAKFTLKELLQSKLIFYTISLSIILMISTILLLSLSYEGGTKILLNLGLGLLTLSSVGSAMFFAGNLYIKEIQNKTLYMLLARPVNRYEFILGKLSGLSFMLLLNIVIMAILVLAPYVYLGGAITLTIFSSIVFIYFEALLVMLILSALSLRFNHLASSIYTLCIYFAGHGLETAIHAANLGQSTMLKQFMQLCDLIVPSFYKLSIRNFAVYNHEIGFGYFFNTSLYVLFYILFLVGITITNFKKMDIE